MASKLYAESAPRGFKAHQVEIPIAKVVNRIKEKGQQDVKNLDLIAKADLRTRQLWLDGKLHADKVHINSIKESQRFFEKNKEWIEKWEQKELDDRVKAAQQEYRQGQQRPPDKSLLEKLGTGLSKAVPTIIEAVQAQQAIQDKAATEAAQDVVFKMDVTPSELLTMQAHARSLANDTVALESYYESLIGKYTDKTGHVFTRDDFVRLLEDSTGAYSIASHNTAAMNGMQQYEQIMRQWHIDVRNDYHSDAEAFNQALEEQQKVALEQIFGEGYFNNEMPHHVKYSTLHEQINKVNNSLRSSQHRLFIGNAERADKIRLQQTVETNFATNNDEGSIATLEGLIQRYGDRGLAFDKLFPAYEVAARNGQMDLRDIDALMDWARTSSRNSNLGFEGNENRFSLQMKHLRRIALNYQQQGVNQNQALIDANNKKYYEAVAQELRNEPSRALALELQKQWRESPQGKTANQETYNQMETLFKAYTGEPQAKTQTLAQELGVPGLSKLLDGRAEDAAGSAFFDQINIPLKSLGVPPANSRLVQNQFQGMVEERIPQVIADGPPEWRNPGGAKKYLSQIMVEAEKQAMEEADRIGLFKVVQDPKDKSKYIFNKYANLSVDYSNSEKERKQRYKDNADTTDSVFLGSASDQAEINLIARRWDRMKQKGEIMTRADVLRSASRLAYIKEMANVLNLPVTQVLADQVKAVHPHITIDESAITTTEEMEGAGARMESLLSGLHVQSPVAHEVQTTSSYRAAGLTPTSHTPGMIPQDAPSGAWRNLGASGPYADILNFIQSVEAVGGYNVLNTVGATPGLDQMTIAEAHRVAMNSAGSGAMGAYQQMPGYLFDRAKSVGLDPNTAIFNKENQEKLAILLINGSGYNAWLDGQLPTSTFANRLAGQWRGLPAGSHNKTYQDQYASANAAGETWDRFIQMLEAHKRMRSQAPGYPYMPSNPQLKSQRGRVI